MCQFKSALVLKDRIFLPDYDSHDKMLQELGIEDNFTNASKVFVRVELSPTDKNIFSAVDGWKLNINQDILPEWWNEAERLPQLKEMVETWMRKHTIYAGEHEVSDGVWLATGSAMVRATGSAMVLAYDSAMVRATGSATVSAYGSATVRATGIAEVTAYNSAVVMATGSATVSAYDSATVIIPKRFETDGVIELNDDSVCINHKTHTIRSEIQWKQEE